MKTDRAAKLLAALIKKNLSLSTAESCSGGALASRITDIPGSSAIFLLGVVTYSNNAKTKILKVSKCVILSEGAVSAIVAKLMSENIRKLAGSNLGVGITGIAGPGGGSARKPVGTVFISVSSKGKTEVRKFHFLGTRQEIKQKTTDKAIEMLLKFAR